MNKIDKIKNFVIISITLVISLITVSCVHDDDYSPPQINYPNLITNYTIPQLKQESTTSSALLVKDSILEGFVVSTDEGGNIYKNLYITTADGKTGIQLNINQSNLYNYYPVGRKVFVKLKGLYLANQNDITQLGGEPYSSSTVGQADWNTIKTKVILAEDKIDESVLTQKFTKISDAIKNENLGTLVEIDFVQFQEKYLNKTFYDKSNTAGSYIEDKDKNILNIRVSTYAKFATNIIPSGSGKIKGILTKYGSTWQLMVRTINDVDMQQARFGSQENNPNKGGGTKESPYTITEAIANQGQTGKWVKGYIVGAVNGKSISENSEFNAPFSIASNILIAASPTETDYSKCMAVQLPFDATGVNTIRQALNLMDNPANLGKEVIIYGDLSSYFSQAGVRNASDYVLIAGGGSSPTVPGNNQKTFVFPGGDFEDYNAFLAGINSFGIKDYAKLSTGTGVKNTNSLQIKTDAATANDYVFTTPPPSNLPQSPTRIQFYIKGTASKSISIILFKADGTTNYSFNLADISGDKVISSSTKTSYTGLIDTQGQWALITLDLSGLTDLNISDTTKNFFGLKVGKDVPYNIYLDDFIIQ